MSDLREHGRMDVFMPPAFPLLEFLWSSRFGRSLAIPSLNARTTLHRTFGRAGSGRLGSGRVGSGRVGPESGRRASTQSARQQAGRPGKGAPAGIELRRASTIRTPPRDEIACVVARRMQILNDCCPAASGSGLSLTAAPAATLSARGPPTFCGIGAARPGTELSSVGLRSRLSS